MIMRWLLFVFFVYCFRVCSNNSDIGAEALEGWFQSALIYTAMTDYPTPSNFMNPLPAYPVRKVQNISSWFLKHLIYLDSWSKLFYFSDWFHATIIFFCFLFLIINAINACVASVGVWKMKHAFSLEVWWSIF